MQDVVRLLRAAINGSLQFWVMGILGSWLPLAAALGSRNELCLVPNCALGRAEPKPVLELGGGASLTGFGGYRL